MIRLKDRSAVPSVLNSRGLHDCVERIRAHVESGGSLKTKDFESSFWRDKKLRKALYEMQSGKCCYCERRRDQTREMDVEHFRPKCGIDDNPEHPGYWWLAYDWENYFYSCKTCNQEHKKNQFPLLNETQRARAPSDDILKERPFLINAESENPEEFIGFEWSRAYGVFVKAVGLDTQDGRGARTIKITGINEGTIPEERARLVKMLQGVVDTMKWALREEKDTIVEEMKALIRQESSSEQQFSGFRRAFFRGNGLGCFVAND